ncbi:sodium-dependent transporter bedraggled isoform X2 [Atheta coriaria]|uniref:sodium-dependent transporter bedraggled isoform X2 n=1 Tax=Dalotia coriaria TaxID=877792 RepID=UPI0031F33A04
MAAMTSSTQLPSTSKSNFNDSTSLLINFDALEDGDDEDLQTHVEALNVLLQLDQILNDCLMEDGEVMDDMNSTTSFILNNTSDVSQAFSDDFVQFDRNVCSTSGQMATQTTRSRSSSCSTSSRSRRNSKSDSDLRSSSGSIQLSIEECLNDLDEYLRSFDVESLDLSSHLNALGKRESLTTLTRSASDCRSRSAELIRNHALRATIAAIKHNASQTRQRVQTNGTPGGSVINPPLIDTSNKRTSGIPDVVIPIDWNWLEGQRQQPGVVIDHMATSNTTSSGSSGGGGGERHTWVRTSMRRLEPLRISDNVNASTMPPDGPTRPISAPSRITVQNHVARSRSRSREVRENLTSRDRARSSSASSRSRRARSLSSVSSLPSSIDSSPSCTPIPTISHGVANSVPSYEQTDAENSNNNNRTCDRSQRNDMPEVESPLGQWPHSMSSTLAYLGCTLGIFNISRFAILSVHFGANFIFQFLIISVCIGIPLFTLYQCLGQQLAAGVIDMWRISPMFQGVGVSLLFFQVLTGLYSIVGISWMFVYFRDAFVTKFERYRWAEPFIYYRNEIQLPINGSYKLSETIPDYLSGVVFQRHHLVSGNAYGTIKFQPAFNLAVVWMIVFVSLSKGLRSYGKVIYVFTLMPIFGMVILCTKLLGLMPTDAVNNIFPETSWNEFFINSRSWMAACQEAFLTWGVLGAAVMQIASHNKNKKLLQRDSSLISFITITVLVLAAFLANTCVHILKMHGYIYQPDSFEKLSTYTFLRHVSEPLPASMAATPVRYMHHHSFILGDRVTRPGIDPATESGYQVLRFATELIPTTFSLLGTEKVSPFWTVLFYFVLILFGIAQQLAIWHCVITGIMAIKAKLLKSWETTITFFSCACGFLLGLPMTTEYGIYVVYFLDMTVGGIWWVIVVILLQIIAVFMVRGRPYSGDMLVTALFRKNGPGQWVSLPVILSFIWNVVLPVVLMVWCITFFKNGNFRELFIWHHGPSLEYWPLWARQVGSLIQLLPVLGVPFIAVIQSYRYLNNGPNDILERIQLLYRPPLGEHMDDLAIQEAAAASMNNNTNTTNTVSEDPPPKYTPPPSYTTATGARIAKLLRQSFRRSVRRIANVLGEASGTRNRTQTDSGAQTTQPPPPDYHDVLVEMHQNRDVAVNIPETRDRMIQRELATIATSSTGLTAADVACILRSSFRRSTVRTLRRDAQADTTMASLSAENLVDSAAPIGETSLVLHSTNNDKDESTVI